MKVTRKSRHKEEEGTMQNGGKTQRSTQYDDRYEPTNESEPKIQALARVQTIHASASFSRYGGAIDKE